MYLPRIDLNKMVFDSYALCEVVDMEETTGEHRQGPQGADIAVSNFWCCVKK